MNQPPVTARQTLSDRLDRLTQLRDRALVEMAAAYEHHQWPTVEELAGRLTRLETDRFTVERELRAAVRAEDRAALEALCSPA